VAATGRRRAMVALVGAAVLATLARGGTIVALAFAGHWFVPEKIMTAAPLLGITALVGVVVVFRVRAAKAAAPALLLAGYAGAVGLGATLLFGSSAGTWSALLIGAAIVAAAGLVTWRVLVPGAPYLRAGVAAAVTVGVAGLGLAVLP